MGEQTPRGPSLRARTRDAMRDEVASVALRLFAENGFDGVTTTQIAAAAGISPSSFFRYFDTKEDVVVGSLNESGARVRDALLARPQAEPAWDSLRMALRALVENPVYPPDSLESVARMVANTPSIRARQLEKLQEWEKLLVPNVAQRLRSKAKVSGDRVDDVARVMVAAAISAMQVTTEVWLRGGGSTDPTMILDELISAVRS